MTLFFTQVAMTQNLVKNPSFENYASCPSFIGELNKADDWSNPLSGTSPDLFNACSPQFGNWNVNVPNNFGGNRTARTGDGYAGIVTFVADPNTTVGCNYSSTNEWREFIQGELSTSLVAGETYRVRFWISLGKNMRFGATNMGVYFSNTQQSSATFYNYSPQLTNSTNAMNDTISWQKLEWSYTALGGEQFFIIGNFDGDTATNDFPSNCNATLAHSYYYIDDVSIESENTRIFNLAGINKLNMYPNPVDNKLYVELDLKESKDVLINILNVAGQTVFKNNVRVNQTDVLELNTDKLPVGVYMVNFVIANMNVTRKLVISH